MGRAQPASAEPFLGFVLDQLGGTQPVTARAIFGGYGLFDGATMFGIVYRGALYLKWADAHRSVTRPRPFKPRARQTLWSFGEVHPEVLENRIVLQRRVARAIEAAIAASRNRGQAEAID